MNLEDFESPMLYLDLYTCTLCTVNVLKFWTLYSKLFCLDLSVVFFIYLFLFQKKKKKNMVEWQTLFANPILSEN